MGSNFGDGAKGLSKPTSLAKITRFIDVVISDRPQTNHSFRPNATFCLYRHPRFGDIPALRSCRALAAGAEVTVNYEYGFDSAPPWYKQLQVDTILEAYNNTRY